MFSVVIPTFNRAALIGLTIDSVLAQELGDFELIIVDDGSTDNTQEVLAAYADPRLRLTRVVNGERGRARNEGTALARGSYVTFLDSDDRWAPTHLTEAEKLIAQHHRPEWCCLPYEVLGANGQRREVRFAGKLSEALIRGNLLSCTGVFVRADIARSYPFEADRRLAGSEDWLLWLQLAARYEPPYGTVITSALIDHAGRSVRDDPASRLYERTRLLVAGIAQDPAFVQKYGASGVRRVHAHMLGYTALHVAMARGAASWQAVLGYLRRCGSLSMAELASRRTLATLKYLLSSAK
jgi:glycosyltransferase involved in cell wall biosynthesis